MMQKDFKILLAALVFSFLVVVGLAALLGDKDNDSDVSGVRIEGVEAVPGYYDLGRVPRGGGLVTREYEVKNTTGKTLTLKKITTSCMCTQAKVTIGGKETKFFGMEHGMDKNPPVNLEFPEDASAKVTVTFDPAAHGPEGVGPFDRSIWLTFSDPAGVKELKFSGTVVSE